MTRSTSRFIVIDILPSLMLLIVGSIMIYSPNATLSVKLVTMFVNLGWILICGGLTLLGLSLFEKLTKCTLCKNDAEHTLPECFNERLFRQSEK